MKIIFLFSLCLVIFAGCTKDQHRPTQLLKKLPLKRLTQSPSLAGSMPRNVKVSPDGKRLTFLKAKNENFRVLDLWEFDIVSGEQKKLVDSKDLLGGGRETLSDAEKARRERKRIVNSGIVEYYWSKKGDQLLFPLGGDLYLLPLNGPVRKITNSPESELDPQFSPLGNFVSYVRNNNIFIYDIQTGKERAISTQGSLEKPIGVAEFIAQEEMRRFRGYWWSPDEKYIAATQVDLTPVDEIKRFEIYSEKVEVIKQRYPKAGRPNAQVRLLVYKRDSPKKPTQVPVSSSDYYIPQARWNQSQNKPQFFYSVQSRDQKTLDFFLFDPVTKKSQKLFSETDTAWVNIRHDYKFLKETSSLLWVSEKSGHAHIYKIDLKTGNWTPLTHGNWDIRTIEAVDEKNKTLYFTATKESPLENHLYRTSLETNQEPLKISKQAGFHRITMVDKPQFYLDSFSSNGSLQSLSSHELDGTRRFFVEKNEVNTEHPLFPYFKDFSQWEYHQTKKEKEPPLYYKVLKPKNFDATKKYPVLQYVYGGPGVQLVTQSGGGRDFFFQFLVQNGFVIVIGDNRGTPHRGHDFERAYYQKFGQLEVKDQATILKHFLDHSPYADSKRVGVFGHSYGGYLSLMLLMQKNQLYQAAVAGAPVVDWSLYDTHYTERFLGHPKAYPQVYQDSNVLAHTDKLKGRLLVVHGMADDNVLYSHSLKLYDDLQEKGLLFDIQAYPGAKHGIRGKTSWKHHYNASLFHFFQSALLKK